MANNQNLEKRRKEQRKQTIIFGGIIILIIAFFVGMVIFGVVESKKQKEELKKAQEQLTEATQQQEETPSKELDTDTSREVKNGDTVAIHFAGSVDGIAFDGGTGDYDLIIGSHSFIDDFEEQLIGHKIGEQVEVYATFPEGYNGSYKDAEGNSHSLSGVEALFVVDINGIYK